MSNEEWAKQEQDTVDFLNSISDEEILECIKPNDNIETIYSALCDKFENSYLQSYPDSDWMFSVWNTYDLKEYLEKRFNNIYFVELT